MLLCATGGLFPFNTSLCQQSDSLIYHGATDIGAKRKRKFLVLFFLISRLSRVGVDNQRE